MSWRPHQSELFLNPKLGETEKETYTSLKEKFNRPQHLWILSSGSQATSSSSAKLIAIHENAFLASAESVNLHLQVTEKDIWLSALPMWHVGGLSIFARASLKNNRVISISDQPWSAENFYKVLTTEKVTLSSLVPTQVFDLVQKGLTAPVYLRAVVIGGAALSKDLYLQARALGWPLLPSFGMTEASTQIATAGLESVNSSMSLSSGESLAGSSTTSLQSLAPMEILSHIKCKTDENRKLFVSGSSLLTGYAQKQNGEEAWVEPVKNGWYETTDEVLLTDKNGKNYLEPLGRGSDFIKVLGEGVSLSQIREQWKNFSPQRQKNSEIFYLPHERKGSEIILISEVEDSQLKSEIEKFNSSLLPFERVTSVYLSEIARTDLGKFLVSQNQERLKIAKKFISL